MYPTVWKMATSRKNQKKELIQKLVSGNNSKKLILMNLSTVCMVSMLMNACGPYHMDHSGRSIRRLTMVRSP